METVRKFMLLEAIRKLGPCPYPTSNNWGYLDDEINELILEGWIEPVDGQCEITDEGKRAILLFNSELADLRKSLDVYKSVVVEGIGTVDARLAICAYRVRKRNDKDSADHLKLVAIAVYWQDFFKTLNGLAESVLWQKVFFSAFEKTVESLADRYSWRKMGRTIQEASLTCERLINPIPSKQLIEITRN